MTEVCAGEAGRHSCGALLTLSKSSPTAMLTRRALLQQAHAVQLMACHPEVCMMQQLGADACAVPKPAGDVSGFQGPHC